MESGVGVCVAEEKARGGREAVFHVLLPVGIKEARMDEEAHEAAKVLSL